MRWMLSKLTVALLLGLATGPLRADPYTQIVVFGDSLSDVGNVFAATGNPPPPNYNGRYLSWRRRRAAQLI
jgi:phospholipase/lecithinase/hemolysin